MKRYDMRFDSELVKSFIGKECSGYKHAEFINVDSVTEVLGIEIDKQVFELSNDFEAMDFFSMDNEATVLRLDKSDWNTIEAKINDEIKEVSINEKIEKVILVNDHAKLIRGTTVEYDMWDTKAIIFFFKDYEICFAKQDCWFSQEIEIYKGYNLIEKIANGHDIIEAFETDRQRHIEVERELEAF